MRTPASKGYALMKGMHIYTVRPLKDARMPYHRWAGFRDGRPWGFFRTKGEFEKAVDRVPDDPSLTSSGEQIAASFHAEAVAAFEADQMLDRMLLQCGSGKEGA